MVHLQVIFYFKNCVFHKIFENIYVVLKKAVMKAFKMFKKVLLTAFWFSFVHLTNFQKICSWSEEDFQEVSPASKWRSYERILSFSIISQAFYFYAFRNSGWFLFYYC